MRLPCLLLLLYVLSAGFSVQYLMWVVPFLIADRDVPALLVAVYLALTTIALATIYMVDGIIYHLIVLPGWEQYSTPSRALFALVYLAAIRLLLYCLRRPSKQLNRRLGS